MFNKETLHPALHSLFCQAGFKQVSGLKQISKCGVYVNSIFGALRVAGELKYHHRYEHCTILFRGQRNDYGNMHPSLFRTYSLLNNTEIQRRVKLFEKLQKYIADFKKSPSRFNGGIGAAVLQHYDVRTAWLDATDNLYVAAYFASNGKPEDYSTKIDNHDIGFIFCLKIVNKFELLDRKADPDEGWNHCWCDLRKVHRPLSLRPHAQHGVFISRPLKAIKDGNIDFSDLIIAVIAFPIYSLRNMVNIDGFEKLLYPEIHDHTNDWLKGKRNSNKKFRGLLEQLEALK